MSPTATIKDFIHFLKVQDQFFTIPIFISISSVILILTGFLLVYPELPTKLPLYYSHPWGESQLVDKPLFLSLPGVIIGTTILNFLISWQLHPSQTLLRRMLMTGLILIDLIIVITAIKIIAIFV